MLNTAPVQARWVDSSVPVHSVQDCSSPDHRQKRSFLVLYRYFTSFLHPCFCFETIQQNEIAQLEKDTAR